MGASVALDVTLTTRPAPRSRICGNTAWVIAMVPKVLVSKMSRTVVMGVASKAPNSPRPALFTSTSMGRAAGDENGLHGENPWGWWRGTDGRWCNDIGPRLD